MEQQRTAHACLGEVGEASAKRPAQQPCAGGRSATDLLHAQARCIPRCDTTKRRFGSTN